MTDFDLQSVVESVADLLSPRAIEKGLELPTYIGVDVPLKLRGDAGRLRQVLLNLTGNALKFTDKGAVAIEVDVAREQPSESETMLRIEVSDTGAGVPEEAQASLFDHFTQADTSTTRKHGGTGLGLAICKELVGLMSGEIGVTSEVGKGSTFWFTASFARQEADTDEQMRALVANLKGRRILVVDDNQVNRRVFEKQLGEFGMIVELAEDAAGAMELLRHCLSARQIFDLAIIDHMMPSFDGTDLAVWIREQPKLADVKLILSSSSGMATSNARAQEMGFDAALPKPIRRSHMLAAVAGLLGTEIRTPDRFADSPAPAAASSDASFRVLVVDDVKVNQRLVSVMLSAIGMRIDLAANGREAVKAVDSLPYDLVLMDVQMPEMDGLEATRQIRALGGAARHVPILAMTANAMVGDREICLQAGMNDYISKPIDKDKLIERARYWLGQDAETPSRGPGDEVSAREAHSSTSEPMSEAAISSIQGLIERVANLDPASPDRKKARR